MNTPHSIAVGKDRRVYVVDRGHNRIQVFDENGRFLDIWPNISTAHYHMMSRDQYVWVADGRFNMLSKYNLNGKFLYGWGVGAHVREGDQPGFFDTPHSISVDQELNLYVAEVAGGRVQKFRPKKGADPAKLIQPELRWPPSTM